MQARRTLKPLTFRAERLFAGRDTKLVAGVDEAGRGPWAGPVVAAAVIFRAGKKVPKGLNDSKLLPPERREELFDAISETAWVGVGIMSVEDIDRINILQATLRAMCDAVAALAAIPEIVLVDGNCCPSVPHPALPVVDGDAKCPSIAAASIIAKVARDRLMEKLSEDFPGYGWHTNKGYGTAEHAKAITRLGVTPHHRRSFAPVQMALAGEFIAGEATAQPVVITL